MSSMQWKALNLPHIACTSHGMAYTYDSLKEVLKGNALRSDKGVEKAVVWQELLLDGINWPNQIFPH
jgi:hypothetical protein